MYGWCIMTTLHAHTYYTHNQSSPQNRLIEGPERAMNEAALLHLASHFPHKQVFDFFELTLEVPVCRVVLLQRVSTIIHNLGRQHTPQASVMEERLQELTGPKQPPDWVSTRQQQDVGNAISALTGAFCRRCYVYGCRTHGRFFFFSDTVQNNI